MSFTDSFEWERVIAPFPAESCGPDMQYHADYERIRRLRHSDSDALPVGVWEREVKKVDWTEVGRLCFDFLAKSSKDLQVAAWLTEALYRCDGVSGAARGLSVFIELVKTYWSDIHPRIEDDDVEIRLRPVNWVLHEAQLWFASESDTGGNLDGYQYWRRLQEAFQDLDAFLDQHAPDYKPNFRDLHDCLHARCLETSLTPQGDPVTESLPPSRGLRSRDAVYDELRQISAFLAKTEPHSPVPMILDAIAEWRDVSFEDLLVRLPSQGGASVYDLIKLFRPGSSR